MSRYIDADKMIDGYGTTFPYDLSYCDDGDLMEWLNAQPTADVVAVVRCKDCKHRYVPTRCALWYETFGETEYFIARGGNFYCSFGERRENDNT